MPLVTGSSTLVPFSLPGVDGAEHGPTPGRPTAVVMWCNHCPYVQAWESRLNAIARDYPDVEVIAIAANDAERVPEDGFDAMVARAREKEYAFPYVQDESQEVARAYGGERTPDVFLFDGDGVLRYHGTIDSSWEDEDGATPYLRDAIDAVREGRDPEPSEVAPVGCTIKWR